MTPERLELLCRLHRHHGWLSIVTLVVAGELYLIGEAGRGARLDSVLTCLKLLSPLARVIAMTATYGNLEEIAAWLSVTHLPAQHRSAELDWTVVDLPKKRSQNKSLSGKYGVLSCSDDATAPRPNQRSGYPLGSAGRDLDSSGSGAGH